MSLIKIVGDDMWDPNNWVPDEHECRIYYSENVDEDYVIVDAVDYAYLVQHKWSLKRSGKQADVGLIYLRRGVSEFYGDCTRTAWYESEVTGRMTRGRNRVQGTVYLHIEIMRRSGAPPPSPQHREVDHINRKTWDCRRSNLRWATRAEQMANSNVKKKGVAHVRKSTSNVRVG